MKKVALVTTDPEILADEDVDVDLIVQTLSTRGVSAEATIWHDRNVDWAAFDLAIMRSPWDYPERFDEFIAWLETVSRLVLFRNELKMIEWNLDKRYLGDLSDQGLPVVETYFCDEADEVSQRIEEIAAPRVIVKPSVSVGSRDTGMFSSSDQSAVALAELILTSDRTAMVQPFVESVAGDGECGHVLFGGEYSHAFRKGPILREGGGFLGGKYTEEISPAPSLPEERGLAEAVVDEVRRLTGTTPLYARVDLVSSPQGPLVLECELVEPSYFLATSPGSEEKFADAVTQLLEDHGRDTHG